jgi:hypothetical protein
MLTYLVERPPLSKLTHRFAVLLGFCRVFTGLGPFSYGASVKHVTHGWGHLALNVRPSALSLATAMKAAKMTNDIEEETKAVPEEEKWSSVGALQDDELDLATGGVRTYGPIMN